MQQRQALGKGIASLIPPVNPTSNSSPSDVPYRMVAIDKVIPNRQQPRTTFDEEKIRELANSIQEEGILQPLIVSPLADGRYELIAGERRLRASRLIGFTEVPVVVKSVDQEGLLALSIVENIQREDLNPIEEAVAYQELITQFNYSQDDVAKRLGKSRVAVTNSLRLLKLPQTIRDDIATGRYSAGHGRALLALSNVHDQLKFRERMMKSLPSVRELEKMVATRGVGPAPKTATEAENVDDAVTHVIDGFRRALGTKVTIQKRRGRGGRIVIDFYSNEDLDRIYRRITTTI